MEEQLLGFPKQFSWEPIVVGTVPAFKHAIVCGMGGSALQAKLLLCIDPELPISVHQDYGLPHIKEGEKPLIVLSSYSGETEEVLDTAREATERGFPCAVVASGGTLLALAKEKNLPYIELPKETAEPRMEIGYAMLALLRMLGYAQSEASLRTIGQSLDTAGIKTKGAEIAEQLKNRLPLIYASNANEAVAYFWKIALNETAKIPAFIAFVPELCHNELAGFDTAPTTAMLSHTMTAVFLHDTTDHPRNEKRLVLVADSMKEKGIGTLHANLLGTDRYTKVLTGALTGVATALALAHHYGVPDAETPLIADFKSRMKA